MINPICWLFGHKPMFGNHPRILICARAFCSVWRVRFCDEPWKSGGE